MDPKILLVAPVPVHTIVPVQIAGQVRTATARYESQLENALQKSHGRSLAGLRHAFSAVPIAHYGLLCIARALHDQGIECQFIWGGSEQDVISKLERATTGSPVPTLVGVGSLTPTWTATARLARYLKSRNPSTKTVVGGPHPTFAAASCLAEEAIDAVVCYAGEQVFLEIALAFLAGRDIESLDIPFLVHRQSLSATTAVPKAPNRSLHSIPQQWQEPLYSLLDSDDLRRIASFVITRRGCPRRCPFCVEGRFWPKTIVSKPVKSAAAEISFLTTQAQQPLVHIADSSFLSDPTYATDLVKSLECSGDSPAISVNVHLEELDDPAAIDLLSSKVVVEILVGLETLSDSGNVAIGRRLSFAEIEARLSALRRTGALVSVYTMLGLPGEDDHAVESSAKRITSLIRAGLIDCTIPKFFVPYPGTRFFEHSEDYHIRINTRDFDAFERWHLPRPFEGNTASTECILAAAEQILESQLS